MWKDEAIEPYAYLGRGCGFFIWTSEATTTPICICVFLRCHDEKDMDFGTRQP